MPLLSFEDASRSIKDGTVLLADTSFILAALNPLEKHHAKAKALRDKLISKSCPLAVNVTVRAELLHKLREAVALAHMKDNKRHAQLDFVTIWENAEDHLRLKKVCEKGYHSFFKSALGNDAASLKAELEAALYGTVPTTPLANKTAKWEHVSQLMAMYGLDSADAMLLNMAVADETYKGIISTDYDFRVCGLATTRKDFNVILPTSCYGMPINKLWRKPA